jgi:hypothetical protein
VEQRELIVRRTAFYALCVVFVSCSRAPERDLFKEGETLYQDGKYTAAARLFKKRLFEKPDDAGVHFYLGTCYLYRCIRPNAAEASDPESKDPNNWLPIAQGELETALSLFGRQGKANPVPHFSSAEYFEMICHVNQAKICLYLINELLENPHRYKGIDLSTMLPSILKKCIEQADEAERVSPGHGDVIGLKKLIQTVIEEAGPALHPPPVSHSGSASSLAA